MKTSFAVTVVEHNIEASGHRNHELVQMSVCMPATIRSARYVIQVIDAFDIERDVAITFDKGQVAAPVLNFRKLNNPAFVQGHDVFPFAWFSRPCWMSAGAMRRFAFGQCYWGAF